MPTTITRNIPAFDILEATTDRDLSYKNYQSLKPVKTGEFTAGLNLDFAYAKWQSFFNGLPDDASIATKQLYGAPLVISFYSKHWHARGAAHLVQLSALSEQVRANGGNLIVISAEAASEELNSLAKDHNLSLNFYFDQKHNVATQLGVFSENDPIWNWFAGVDQNVPMLATYVIGTEKNVVYAHNERDHWDTLNDDAVINAVSQSAFINNLLLSA